MSRNVTLSSSQDVVSSLRYSANIGDTFGLSRMLSPWPKPAVPWREPTRRIGERYEQEAKVPCGCTSGSSECCLIKLAERESQFRQRLMGLVKLEGSKLLGVEHGKRIRLERGWRPRALEGRGCCAREFRLDPVAGGAEGALEGCGAEVGH